MTNGAPVVRPRPTNIISTKTLFFGIMYALLLSLFQYFIALALLGFGHGSSLYADVLESSPTVVLLMPFAVAACLSLHQRWLFLTVFLLLMGCYYFYLVHESLSNTKAWSLHVFRMRHSNGLLFVQWLGAIGNALWCFFIVAWSIKSTRSSGS